jgi:hypothetical protein
MHLSLIKKKECSVLTYRGYLFLLSVMIFIIILFVSMIHPFLAITERIKADYLVIEGWLPDFALRAALKEFKENNYKMILVTGGPISSSSPLYKYKTFANSGAMTLKKIDSTLNFIQIVPSSYVKNDRTYTSALAIKKWALDNKVNLQSINLLSLDCHARRSRYLFQKVLKADTYVGIISINNEPTDSEEWFKYGDSAMNILRETTSYLYTILFY